jgi:opacity protein-like surface antigen
MKGEVHMRYTVGFILAAGLLTVCPMTAQAQEDRVDFSLGGGFTAPNSEVRDHLGDGYNFNFGVQVNVSRAVAIEGLYSFNGLGDKRISIPVSPTPFETTSVPTDFSADMNMQYFTVSAVFQRPEGSGVRPYGLIGMGAYYRPVKVTTPAVGFAPGFCDPYWYVCYPGQFVPVENVIGKRSSTDFGMDFGGGANFGTFYTELRYHYIWGPTVPTIGPVQPLPGVSAEREANGQFLQFTFGFRF